MASLGALGLAWLVGYGLCRAALRASWRGVPVALRLGLGWAAGAAAAGLATFGAVALAPGYRGAAVGLAAVAGLALWLVRPSPAGPDAAPRPRGVAWWAGAAAFAAVLAVWLAHGLDIAARAPAGGWDAWSIWVQRARFFYLCPREWTRGFDPDLTWSHPEYPTLLPSLIVFGWLPAGRCVAASPVAVALATHVALLLLVVGLAQAAYPGSARPWAFGVFYATVPQEWSQEGAWQYADRPLAVFLLAGAGCAALALRRRRRAWLLPAGFFWGAAAFTKDEGKAALAVLAVGAAAAALVGLVGAGRRRVPGAVALLALGLAPGVAALGWQHARSPVPSHLLEKMTADPLTDTGRTAVIAHSLLDRLDDPAAGFVGWGCAFALLTLWPWLRREHLVLWLVPAAQLAVYLVVFQLTPMDLKWHLDSALARLLMHVGPIAFTAAAWLVLEAERRGELRPEAGDPDGAHDPDGVIHQASKAGSRASQRALRPGNQEPPEPAP